MGLISRVSSRTYRFILTKIPYKNNNMIFVRGSETLNIEKPATEAELFEIISNQEQAHIEQLTLSVKGETPKVEPEEKKKKKTGRAARRAQYNRRFVMASSAFGGKRKGPNCQADRTDNK